MGIFTSDKAGSHGFLGHLQSLGLQMMDIFLQKLMSSLLMGYLSFLALMMFFFGTVLAESLLIGDIDDIHSIMHGSKLAP